MLRKSHITLFLLLISLLPEAQPFRQYSFTHYGKREGLAGNGVTSIVQDKRGFTWIGSMNGLQRFDGTRFLTFRHQAGQDQLPSNQIIQLHVDIKGRLWILFNGEDIGIFDTKKLQFRKINAITKYPSTLRAAGKKLMEDNYGNIYLLIHTGTFLTYDPAKNQFSEKTGLFNIPEKWRVKDMVQDPVTKKYWIACDSGLVVFNPVTQKLSYRPANAENEPVIRTFGDMRFVYSLLLDSKRRLWIQSRPPDQLDAAIHCINVESGAVTFNNYRFSNQLPAHYDITRFIETKNGSTWIYGPGILAEYLEQEKKLQVINSGMSHERGIIYETIQCLFEDKEQNIWLGTNSNGIYHYNPSAIFFQRAARPEGYTNSPGKGPGYSFMSMKDESLLTGIWGGKLNRFDSQLKNMPVNIPGLNMQQPFWTLYRPKDSNNILIGAQPGFYIYNEHTNKTSYYNPAIFENGAVNNITQDSLGNWWFGVLKEGLFKWSASKGALFPGGITEIPGIFPFRITKTHVDRNGFVWVSYLGSGLDKMDPVNDTIILHLGTREADHQKLLDDNVRSFLFLNDSTIAIAAGGLSFYNIKSGTIRHLTMEDGLPSDIILSLVNDGTGGIWMSTYNGICHYNLQNKSFVYFDRYDGILNDYFEEGAAYKLPDGRLLFATFNDFIAFNPSVHGNNFNANSPELTGFKTANKSLSIDSLESKKMITLCVNENSITIEFSDMSYLFNYNLSYKLEGLDNEWRKADALNQAIYSYLPPGSYTFIVQAEAHGKVIRQSQPLHIKVLPPFWRTWWFYGIVLLAIALILFWLDKERMEKRKAIQSIRTRIAGELHDEINVTLNNIYLLSEMARIKADNNAVLSKEYIGQIHNKSKTMITVMDDILWNIKPENDSMEKFFWRIRELTEALSHENNNAIVSVTIAEKVKTVNLPVKHRMLFFLIIKEALQAVIVYGKGKETMIDIDVVKGNVSFRLHDKTAYFDKTRENLNSSLLALQDRAGQMKADLHIQANTKGVTITLLSQIA